MAHFADFTPAGFPLPFSKIKSSRTHDYDCLVNQSESFVHYLMKISRALKHSAHAHHFSGHFPLNVCRLDNKGCLRSQSPVILVEHLSIITAIPRGFYRPNVFPVCGPTSTTVYD